jgi:hypothetical protein
MFRKVHRVTARQVDACPDSLQRKMQYLHKARGVFDAMCYMPYSGGNKRMFVSSLRTLAKESGLSFDTLLAAIENHAPAKPLLGEQWRSGFARLRTMEKYGLDPEE